MTNATIKAHTREQIDRVVSTILSLDWSDKRIYGDMLAQTYYHIVHSTRLLATAGALFPPEQEKFHLHCLKHAFEERSHEMLSLSDLKNIGFKLEQFPELPGTKALYRSAYHLIERHSPFAVFGYAYFLEWIAIAAGEPVMEKVRPLLGAKSVKHMHVHTNEDPEHILAYEGMLEQLTGKDREAVVEAINTTAAEYERMFLEIKARQKSSYRSKAA